MSELVGGVAGTGRSTGIRLGPEVRRAAIKLSDITGDLDRTSTGIADLDGVLGGGLVAGALILLGGEPGVGKSTLVLEVARAFKGKLLYYSGEESPRQIAIRARRLGISSANVEISQETDLAHICEEIKVLKPGLVVIDSIQTVQHPGFSPGSPTLLREAAFHLMETAKSLEVPLMVTGHITKDGAIAGPRLLEHMVDTVLLFESDRLKHFRILRAVKNRFGPVGEVALFEMREGGLSSVHGLALDRDERPAPGRVYATMQEGSRSICAEVQALVSRCYAGPPRRMADGLDNRRLILIGAVLEKFLKLRLSECDVFANLAGGLSSDDPGLDLGLCAAVLSSYNDRIMPGSFAFIGEVGLSGEVRTPAGMQARIRELTQMGFTSIVLPESAAKEIGKVGQPEKRVSLKPIQNIVELAALIPGEVA